MSVSQRRTAARRVSGDTAKHSKVLEELAKFISFLIFSCHLLSSLDFVSFLRVDFFKLLDLWTSSAEKAGLFPTLTREFCLTLAAISQSQAGKGEAYTWTLRCLALYILKEEHDSGTCASTRFNLESCIHSLSCSRAFIFVCGRTW